MLTSPTILLYVGCFLATIAMSVYLTWQIREIAVAHNWIEGPRSERHLHTSPKPRFGGLAIYLSFLFGVAFLLIMGRVAHLQMGFSTSIIAKILLPASLLFAVGFYDDVHGMAASSKFAFQIFCASILFLFGFSVLNMHWMMADMDIGILINFAATLLWVLAISNSFNLIDGLDGLASGAALFSMVTVFVVSLTSGNDRVSVLTMVLAAAILGFLKFNFSPATIFLGDCGSLFLGFMLSALAMAGKPARMPGILAIIITALAFGLPLVETLLSVLRRFLSGKPLFAADREHIHHKLLDMGLSHRRVVVILYVVSGFCAMMSLFLIHPTGVMTGMVMLVVAGAFMAGIQHLSYPELNELRRVAKRTVQQKQIIVNNLKIRRAGSLLREVKDFDELVKILQESLHSNEFDYFEVALGPKLGAKGKNLWTHSARTMTTPTLSRKRVSPQYTDVSAWSLTIDLATSGSGNIGFFKVIRCNRREGLLLDVNILISELQPALCQAGECLLNSHQEENYFPHTSPIAISDSVDFMKPALGNSTDKIPAREGRQSHGAENKL